MLKLDEKTLKLIKTATHIRISASNPEPSSRVVADVSLWGGEGNHKWSDAISLDLTIGLYGRTLAPSNVGASIDTYPGIITTANSILRSLKVGDEISLEVGADVGSTSMREAGWIRDVLFLNIRRGTQAFKFVLDEVITGVNGYRMVTPIKGQE